MVIVEYLRRSIYSVEDSKYIWPYRTLGFVVLFDQKTAIYYLDSYIFLVRPTVPIMGYKPDIETNWIE